MDEWTRHIFDVHGSASGSVIDFVMWQEGANFGKACQILSDRITPPAFFNYPHPHF